jgi:light-regulated signal transduction histidine kinase (bacteriophytochrome)
MEPARENSTEMLLKEIKALEERYKDLFQRYNINLETIHGLKELLSLADHDHKLKQAQLDTANKEIAYQNRDKELRAEAMKELEAFSYSVSHDLRAPLRHINGYVDLLLSRYYEQLPEQAKHYLDSVADAARKMDTLINDLLEFSRTGRKEIQKADVDMNEIVEEVILLLKKNNSNRQIEWKISKLPLVHCDEALIYLVWQNLLDNAVKFTQQRDKAIIKIEVTEKEHEYVFSVNDNGVGFDEKYAQNLFGVFQRLHSHHEFEGTGIGLALVRSIILKHKGFTWAEAESDKGATFYFSLPKNSN